MRTLTVVLTLAALAPTPRADALVTFDDVPLAPNSFYNGGPTTNANGFTSGGAFFRNSYDSRFGGFWSGFSVSNVNDATTSGFANQYAAFAGAGFGGSGNYAVAYPAAFINLPAGERPAAVRITNTTYAALSIRDGDGFAKKFGGPTGNDPDFFSVTLTGYDAADGSGGVTGVATLLLADYRFADNALDYIVDDWQLLDLSPLGAARSISLGFASSDVGQFGINTPTYAAIDSLALVPEPATLGLVALPLLGLRRRQRERAADGRG